MELKEFSSRTLTEISEGVAKAATDSQVFGAIVSPKERGPTGVELKYGKTVNVEFTVGLSITDGTATKGGIGVVTGIFALGSQGASNASTNATTHVKFEVPLLLPAPISR